jgi:hypothetical protein
MAAYATSQAGLWSSSSTWGGAGVPSNTDTVTITHAVIYDVNDDTNTIASIALNTGGKLEWTGGTGTLALRFTNMTITGGKLIGKDGTFIRCLGYIQVANTAASDITMKGSVPNFQTVLDGNTTVGNGFISVIDSSGFGTGDYISVYNYNDISWDGQYDECFIVNSVSGNTVYLRRFVGPEFILTQTTSIGNNLFYTSSDVRPWVNGSKFVVDSEVFEVQSIDVFNKIIYTTSGATSEHVSGVKAYETGIEKTHLSGYTVYKLAASIITGTSGNDYIDVSNAGGWSVGDQIAFGGCTLANSEEKTIDSISLTGGTNGSSRIYLTTGLTNNHEEGGIAVKLNRDCVFYGNATNTVNTTSGYIYYIAGATARLATFENFEMRYYGGTATYTWGLTSRTYHANGTTLLNVSGRDAGAGCGRMGMYSYYYGGFHNNVFYNTGNGLAIDASISYSYLSGNICMKIPGIVYILGNGINNAFEYNIAESCAGNYTFASTQSGLSTLASTYGGRPGSRFYYARTNYSSSIFYNAQTTIGNNIKNILIKNTITRIFYPETNSRGGMIYSDVCIEGTVSTTSIEGTAYSGSHTQKIFDQISIIDTYNFIPKNVLIKYCYGHLEMDENIKVNSNFSWKGTPKANDVNYIIGMFAFIVGKKGRTIKAGSYLRKNSSVNGVVKLEMYDDVNTLLASSILSVNDDWQWKTMSYTLTRDTMVLVKVGGYGTAGNFWISNPTLFTDGCLSQLDVLSNYWIIGDPESTGIRMTNGIKLI